MFLHQHDALFLCPMDKPITVKFEYTANSYKASQWLEELPNLFAADFEVSPKFTEQDRKLAQMRLDTRKNLTPDEILYLEHIITASGLSHPSLTQITHLNLAWSEEDARVIICDNQQLRNLVCRFLAKTNKHQIWHNACYDFRYIKYHTGKIPINFTDTQLLAKCLLNDADSFKDQTGLKHLMGDYYGTWAIAKDNFVLEEQYSESMLKYAATDACATYKLYNLLQLKVKQWKI